jgi:hypothetical protein
MFPRIGSTAQLATRAIAFQRGRIAHGVTNEGRAGLERLGGANHMRQLLPSDYDSFSGISGSPWPKPNFSACMAITGKIRIPKLRQLG